MSKNCRNLALTTLSDETRLEKKMDYGLLITVGAGSFLCGVALMYLVMSRTMKKRAAEAGMTA